MTKLNLIRDSLGAGSVIRYYHILPENLTGRTMRLISAVLCSILAMLVVAMPALAQPVTVERDSELRAEARADAPVTAKVKQGTSGEVTAKNGAWVNIKTAEGAGWVFSFNVRFGTARPGSESSAGDGGAVLGRLVAPRTQVNVTATLGTRGLDKEDLRQASFNAEQMKLLEQYAASKESAQDGARARGLEPVRVEYLGAKS